MKHLSTLYSGLWNASNYSVRSLKFYKVQALWCPSPQFDISKLLKELTAMSHQLRFDNCIFLLNLMGSKVALMNGKLERKKKLRLHRSYTEYRLEALHEIVQYGLKSIGSIALPALRGSASEDQKKRLHLALTSFVADVAEAVDLLSMKRDAQTMCLCHNCLEKSDQFPYVTGTLTGFM